MERQLSRHKKRRKFSTNSCCYSDRLCRKENHNKRFSLSSLLKVLSISTALSIVSIAATASALATPNQIVVLEQSNNSTQRFNSAINVQYQQIQASFSTPNQAINITHVTYDPLYDSIYVGATNTIYQLNGSDLSEQYEQSTGPVNDNPSCGVSECHGYEDLMKPTQNVNKVLVIDYQHKKVLSCGSTKQGACRRYQLNNISQKEDLISMPVAANDDNSSTLAFIAPARYTYDPSTSDGTFTLSSNQNSAPRAQQQVLYVATTYTKVGQSRDQLVPAIGTRILDDGPNLLKLYENSFLDSARIDINSHLRDYFLVNYLFGFASSNYIYFVTVQKKATSRDYEELGYHTRLARICITDSSYNSYTEIDLKCLPNKKKSQPKHSSFFGAQASQQQHQSSQHATPSEYPLLQDAILVDAGSLLLQSLAQNDQSSPASSSDFFFNNPSSGSTSSDDSKVLLGVFSSAKDHTQYAGEHSALCAFSLSQIEEKFNDNIHNCYTGKMQSRNMEYIAGNVQECPKSGQGGNVVNFCHETLKINGTIPIVSEASIQYFNTTLTAITATSQVNSNTKNIYSDQLASDLSAFNSSKSTTSIPSFSSASQQQQQTVVFMGTSNGHIKKLLLNNASNGIEFEDVQLDTNPILSDLHLHSSGQQLIVATPYKVMKVPVHNCAQHSSCRECSQSKSPYCGWCSLKRSCTTRNECVSGSSASNELAVSSTQTLARNVASQVESSRQLKWISNDSMGKCIDLQSIVPDKIPITSTGKVDLYIDRLPRLPKEHNYKCIFDRKEQTTATLMSFGLSCPLPKVMHRPKIQPGRDHAIVDLAVRSSETNIDFLNGKITFFECQLHTTCKDCLTTNWGCNWCLNENICLFNTSKCEKTGAQARQDNLLSLSLAGKSIGGQQQLAATTLTPSITITNGENQRSSLSLTTVSSSGAFSSLVQGGQQRSSATSNTINMVNQCPTFDVGYKQDILIADGSERELTIKVKNMPQFKGNIQCIVEIESDKIPLKARIDEDRVICENLTYSYTADVGLLNGQLVVIYSDNNIFIDRTNFTMYKCHLLGAYLNRPDCSLCQRIDSRFNCAWCSGACNHRSRCTERPADKCPAPRIDYVYPLSGPIQGGTKVTIEGSNLGQSFEEIVSRVSVGGVPCRPIEDEYKPSNKIVCVTGPYTSKFKRIQMSDFDSLGDENLGDIMVGNKAGYSVAQSKFHYKSIFLRDHQPRYGPQSGGTRVTLTGINLNVGSNIQVFLDELACLIEPSLLTSEQIVCVTSASRHASRTIKELKLVVDEAVIVVREDVYYYTQDPVISRISPLHSYVSGGRSINVYGANLTSVQLPRMAILDAAGKKINESICILQDDSRMQCPSPAVSLPQLELELNEQHPGNQQYDSSSPSSWTPIGTAAFQQQDEIVKFRLSFIMDNVWRVRDLHTSFPSVNSDISYTSDPKFFPFASSQYKAVQEIATMSEVHDQQQQQQEQSFQLEPDIYLLQPGEPSLILYGEYLRSAMSEYEITVTVGQDLCNLTQLTQNKLVCIIPLDHMATPTDEEGHLTQKALPLVVIRIGFNLRFEIGYVQYHRKLVEQILQTIANSSERLPYMRHTYPHYMPRENESIFRKLSSYVMNILLFLLYLALGSILLALVYSSMLFGYKLKKQTHFKYEYDRFRNKIDALEKSIKSECRIASLALQSELSELVRNVDLSGVPLLNPKLYIMKVFFPGINNHPLLIKSAPNFNLNSANSMSNLAGRQDPSNFMTLQHHPGKASSELPMEYFERLILNKPFLITFINTLEAQPNFTIRDKVNVASLIMTILLQRLDYATDIMRTLIFQLVEKSVNKSNLESYDKIESKLLGKNLSKSISRKASNFFGDMTSSDKRSSRAVALGKAVGGSASSLMASTTVAAQMLLSRVGSKTSPLQPHHSYLNQTNPHSMSNTLGHDMSTTTFNQQNAMINTIGRRSGQSRITNRSATMKTRSVDVSGSHLMLRQTDSVVEKMLTNWLALNMYDYFQGEVGQSLYMMFEALRHQLDRGPIESVSGDAYYSLNEQKLLKDLYIQFDLISIYVVVDTDIFQSLSKNNNSALANNQNLLLDSTSATPYNITSQQFCDVGIMASSKPLNYSTSNTITLSMRVLDCDSISQVKGKILNSLYQNLPYSSRLKPDDVELSLRQPFHDGQGGLSSNQYVNVTLHDEDYSSTISYNGLKRINTLKHYGVIDQAVMSLNRIRQSNNPRFCPSVTRTTLTDMLDEHYNNPYSEIQYGAVNTSSNVIKTTATSSSKWHLIKPDQRIAHLSLNSPSNESSPSSNSPSMMLLGNEPSSHNSINAPVNSNVPHLIQQQQYYHPSSSSTSSTGNVMDTNSTSANSSSVNVTNLLKTRHEQPIYCQIGSTAPSRQGGVSSSYYCQIGNNVRHLSDYQTPKGTSFNRKTIADQEHEQQIYLKRMLTSKGTVQSYIDNFFKTILNYKTKQHTNQAHEDNNFSSIFCNEMNGYRATGACPAAVKWLFDLLDEAAIKNGVTDDSVIHSWKSNSFLLRFWVNIIKNPDYILDVEKSSSMDATLSVIAQTLMDACAPNDKKPTNESTYDKLLFAKDIPKYKGLVKRFYQDIASMRPVCDQEIVKQMSSISMNNTGRFDTNLALKELCVYAVNYGVELMEALNNDINCQQLDLSQQLEQCFRSFTIFEAYR